MCSVWKEQWQDIVGDPYEQAQTLPEQQDVPAVAQPAAEDVDLATFQFQLRANAQPPSTTQAMVRAAIGFAVGKLRDDLEEMKQNQHEVLEMRSAFSGCHADLQVGKLLLCLLCNCKAVRLCISTLM